MHDLLSDCLIEGKKDRTVAYLPRTDLPQELTYYTFIECFSLIFFITSCSKIDHLNGFVVVDMHCVPRCNKAVMLFLVDTENH